jgi:transposase-like protein
MDGPSSIETEQLPSWLPELGARVALWVGGTVVAKLILSLRWRDAATYVGATGFVFENVYRVVSNEESSEQATITALRTDLVQVNQELETVSTAHAEMTIQLSQSEADKTSYHRIVNLVRDYADALEVPSSGEIEAVERDLEHHQIQLARWQEQLAKNTTPAGRASAQKDVDIEAARVRDLTRQYNRGKWQGELKQGLLGLLPE